MTVYVYRSSGESVNVEVGESKTYKFRIYNDGSSAVIIKDLSDNWGGGQVKIANITNDLSGLLNETLKAGESKIITHTITGKSTGSADLRLSVGVYTTKGSYVETRSSATTKLTVTPQTNHISTSINGDPTLELLSSGNVNVTFKNNSNSISQKVKLNQGVYSNCLNVSNISFEEVIPAGGSKILTLSVKGLAVDIGNIAIVYNVLKTDDTLLESNILSPIYNIQVTEPENYLSDFMIVNTDGVSSKKISSDFNVSFKNIFTTVNIEDITFIIDSNFQSYMSILKDDAVEDYYFKKTVNQKLEQDQTLTIPFKLNFKERGTGNIRLLIHYTTSTSNKSQEYVHQEFIEDEFDADYTYTLSDEQVTVGNSLYLNLTINPVTGTGFTEKQTIKLPEGITAEDGSQYIIFDSEKVKYDAQLIRQSLIKTIIPGTYTIQGNTLTVNPLTIDTTALDNNYVIISPSSLEPNIPSQLIVKYEVINKELSDDYYPIIIPETQITLPNQLKFTNSLKSIKIPEVTLKKGQVYENKDYFIVLDENSTSETLKITCSNSILGSKFVEVISNPSNPNLLCSIPNSSQDSIIDYVDGLSYILAYNIVNAGNADGKLNSYSISLESEGNIATFADGTTNLNYSNPDGIIVKSGENYNLRIPIYISNHSKNITIVFNCNDLSSSHTISRSIYISSPESAKYSFELQVDPKEIEIYSDDKKELADVGLVIKNINNVSSETTVMVHLDTGLSFEDDSVDLIISNIVIGANESVTVNLPKVKGVIVGNNSFDVRIGDELILGNIIVTEPLLESEGESNITNCKFVGNSGSVGGVIYNLSNLNYVNCNFLDNSASSKCPVIYDKGVCRL